MKIGGRRIRIWPMLPQTEIPAYLELMERKGLRFEKVWLGQLLGVFRRIEPSETRYEWDYYIPGGSIDEQVEDKLLAYQEFFEEAGWEIVWQFEYSKIFREIPGRNPLPVHTDEDIRKEKYRRYSKKYELFQGLVSLVLVLFLGWFAGGDLVREFPITTAYGELSSVLIVTVFILLPLWYLVNAWRCWAAGGDPPNESISPRRVRLAAFFSAFIWVGLAIVLLEPLIEQRNSSYLAGMAIGFPIGAAIRRGYTGLGAAAKKMGVKGIGGCGWKHILGSLTIALALVIYTFLPFFSDGQEDIRVLQGRNLYCEKLYKEDLWSRSPSYYEAKDDEAAEAIVNAYIDAKPGKWESSWRPIDPDVSPDRLDVLAQLHPVGPYAVPRKENVEIYWSPFMEDWEDSTGEYLVRDGRKIWLTSNY